MIANHKYYETARQAYRNISFFPEKSAESECSYFDAVMTEFESDPDVQCKFEKLFSKYLAAKSRCLSSAITGPARFPVARAEKANNCAEHAAKEMMDCIDRLRKAKAKEAYYTKHPEARPISSGDGDAIERLEDKLKSLKKSQETMKAVNGAIRAKDMGKVVEILGEAHAALILKPDFAGRIGFAPYALRNNLAEIKRVEMRIKAIKARKATTPKDITINGVRVVENTEEMRLQVFFNGKPARDMIDKLKRNAFKWSPHNMAWQRQLTNNAIDAFNHSILPAIKSL